MTAYVMFMREGPLADPGAYEAYVKKNMESPPPATMSVCSMNPKIEPLEGEPVDSVVLLSFPTVEEAKAWYGGPYNQTVPLRQKAGNYRAFIFEGQ